MKEERAELLKGWRDISWWDRVRSCFQKTPATFGKYNQAYSDLVIRLLSDEDLKVVEVTKHRMLVDSGGKRYDFWISNYPYYYGGLRLHSTHKWFHSKLNWEAILMVRELQLQHREEFFRNYDEDQSKLYD